MERARGQSLAPGGIALQCGRDNLRCELLGATLDPDPDTTMLRPLTLVSIPALAVLISGAAQAAALPPQALGKTVTFTYTASIPTKLPNGSIKTTSRTETRTIYISSAGRMFMRNSRHNSASASETIEQGPDKTSGSLRYADGAIIGTVMLVSGAYQFTIRLDPSFQSCNATMIFGSSAGEGRRKWKSVDGQMLEAAGKGSVSTSCSVAAGNSL